MREDGFNSGQRNIGRFFLSAVPLVLGAAAFVWLGVWIGLHQWKHELSQEDRAAMYVGALERPKSKIKAEIQQSGCVTIDRVDIDGNQMMVYTANHCHSRITYLEYHYTALSPKKYSISSDWTNSCNMPTQPGDRAECRLKISDDDRISSVRVWLDAGALGWRE